jgi:hypothetical protein
MRSIENRSLTVAALLTTRHIEVSVLGPGGLKPAAD